MENTIERDEGQVVFEFQKNAMERVRASLTTYHGRALVDLRVYYEDGDEFKPSRKGLMISVEKLPELAEAVERLREAVEGDG